jgi:lipid-binding SYLF domain-containing protein
MMPLDKNTYIIIGDRRREGMKNSLSKSAFLGLTLISLVLFVPWLGAARPSQESAEEESRVEAAILAFEEIAGLADKGIPESVLKEAHGIAILPGVVKAAYGIGGEYGRGVLLVQEKGAWSNPSFIKLAGGSLGWQIGVQKSDLVLVFKTRQSIDNIAEGKITLGADASVAAGPVGRGAQANTDLDLKAEIYAYSKAKGLFAGISLKGAAIQIDGDSNEKFYKDRAITARRIFTEFGLEGPPVAAKLRTILTKYLSSEYRI